MFKHHGQPGGIVISMEISQHIAALERDGALLADAAADAGLTEEVPACPGWRVRDLVRHQAFVHAWAARHIIGRRAGVIEDATEDDILGGGPRDAFDPGFAADGIDELVRGFAARQKANGVPRELLVRSADTGDAWSFTWPSEGPVRTRRYGAGEETGPADCVLAGPASGVYLFLWNRCIAADADVVIAGDHGILRTWSRCVRVRWT